MSNMSKVMLCLAAATLSNGAQAASVPRFAPNPAVSWMALYSELQPPPSGPGPVLQDPAHPRVTNAEFRRTGRQPTQPIADLGNPILQPWAREELRRHNARVLSGQAAMSRSASCWPEGVPTFLLHAVRPYFFIQTPDKVLLIYEGDADVRHIYLTDRHSENVKASWFGESIGHYEGDTLVVDTIGLTTKTFVDNYYTPHTGQLHVVERFRLLDDGDGIEARVHVEDPGAFTTPWDAVQRFRRIEPGRTENDLPLAEVGSQGLAAPLQEVRCAESTFSFSGDRAVQIPHADEPDF
jgi:hypothetical protein